MAMSEFDQRLRKARTTKEAITILNERHFTVKVGSKMAVVDIRPPLSLMSYDHFRNRYLSHQRLGVNLGTLYLKSLQHLHYDGAVVFKPDGSPIKPGPDDYNMWTGFAVKPRKGKWNFLDTHIRENLCSGNEDEYRYLRRWMALLVQQPGRLPGVSVVLRGGEGTGKTSFYEYLARMFPRQHCQLVSSPRGLTGQFNAHLKDKVLVCADEAFFVGDRSVTGTLQSFITSPRMAVEFKGVDVFEVDSCPHLIIASNSDHVIQAAKKARRYFALNVRETHQKDYAYFNKITKQQDEEHGTAAMLYDLRRENLTGFNPMEFPQTDALNEQKALSLEPHAAWLLDRLMEPSTWQEDVLKKDFYHAYRETVTYYPLNRTVFTQYLQKIFGLRIHFRPHGEKRRYLFPPLAESRQCFDRYHDLHTEWEPGVVRLRRQRLRRQP